MKNHTLPVAAALGMLALILDGKTALYGASEGVRLCLNTLIPSLFPFFVLSALLTASLCGRAIPFLQPLRTLCKIPQGAESLLAIGFLGGYPVGARNVALFRQSGSLSDSQSERLIVLCNNAGPSFLFGILGPMFSDKKSPWLLWAIHILSALMVGVSLPGETGTNSENTVHTQPRLTDALEQSVRVMALVCGWVILVKMVLTFLDRWFLFLFPESLHAFLCGILELSNGCIRLGAVGDENLRFLIASCLLSLGGVCVTLQTRSVTEGISMRLYFPGKMLQCCISAIFSSLLFPVRPLIPCLAMVIGAGCIVSLRLFEKSSRISAAVGV